MCLSNWQLVTAKYTNNSKSCHHCCLFIGKYTTVKSYNFPYNLYKLYANNECVLRYALCLYPFLKLCSADVVLWPSPPLSPLGCGSVRNAHFKGFQLQGVEKVLSSLCIFPSYLHLSVQPGFLYKGNGASVHRRGALQLQVGVVNVVMGVIYLPVYV